jgi:hypothetical protein
MMSPCGGQDDENVTTDFVFFCPRLVPGGLCGFASLG